MQKGNPVLILENGGVLKRQGVAIETKLRACRTCACQRHSDTGDEPAKNRRCALITENHIKSALQRLCFCLRQKCRADEIFDIASPAVRRLESAKSAAHSGAARSRHSRQ